MSHCLNTEMSLPLPIGEVFSFFSDAANLEAITPPELGLKILTERPITMAPGALIDYRLRLFGFSFKWRTRITSWNPPHGFVDEQMSGPYKEWVHTHTFKEISGGTSIFDVVKYRFPLWPFGEIAYPIVRRQLDRVFRFRQQSIVLLLVGEASGGA